MLLVRVYLDRSAIEGIGVFAREPIPAGTVVWQLDPRYDRLIPVEQWEAETGVLKDYLDRYSYPHRADPRFIVFEGDDARYMNHSDRPNCDVSGGDRTLAMRDIEAGEELTCDYNHFFDDGFEFLGDR